MSDAERVLSLLTNASVSGDTFGRLTVLHLPGHGRFGTTTVRVRCVCGTEQITDGRNLVSGIKRSCGCLYHEAMAANGRASRKHGESRPAASPEYTSWSGMRARVLNPKCPAFGRYGGLGLTICERWDSYENFLADMGRRPPGTSIDRIDPAGNYEPANCRWADRHTQRINQRPHALCRRGHPYVARRGENFCLTCHARRGRERRARLTRARLALRSVA